MKNEIAIFTAFVTGGISGFALANKLLKDKYNQLAQDEIDSVKAAFRKEHPLPEKGPQKPSEKERKQYSQRVTNLGYTSAPQAAPIQAPHVITFDEFGDQDEYEEISLTCYSDGTVADDSDRAMDETEIAETIGADSLTHFGECEEDCVYVRNDRLKVDYEILMDQRSYADILREKPYLVK